MTKLFKDIAEIEYGIVYGADLFINRSSGIPVMPVDLMETDVVSISLDKDQAVPKYIYYCFEHIYKQGFWNFNKVTVDTIKNIQLSEPQGQS